MAERWVRSNGQLFAAGQTSISSGGRAGGNVRHARLSRVLERRTNVNLIQLRADVLQQRRMGVHQFGSWSPNSIRRGGPGWSGSWRAGIHRPADGTALRSWRIFLYERALPRRFATDTGLPAALHATSLRHSGPGTLDTWSEEELAQFLETGANAQGIAFGSMSDVIVHSTQYITPADALANAKYLKALRNPGEGPPHTLHL